MEEAKEKFHEAVKELTEANTELQELMAGPIALEVSIGGLDVVSPMAAAMEQLLQTVERSWAPGMQQTDSLAEAVQNGRKGLENVRRSKSKSPVRKQQATEPAAVPIPPIHHVISESDTEMDDEGTQNAGMKRPIDMADDLHKATEEARKVLPDLPMSAALRRATQVAQWSKRLRTMPTDDDHVASKTSRRLMSARWRVCRTKRRCWRDGLPERIRRHLRHLRARAGRCCSVTSTRSTPGRARSFAGCAQGGPAVVLCVPSLW